MDLDLEFFISLMIFAAILIAGRILQAGFADWLMIAVYLWFSLMVSSWLVRITILPITKRIKLSMPNLQPK